MCDPYICMYNFAPFKKILVYRGGIRFKVMHACHFASQQRAHPPSLRFIIMTCRDLLLRQDSTLMRTNFTKNSSPWKDTNSSKDGGNHVTWSENVGNPIVTVPKTYLSIHFPKISIINPCRINLVRLNQGWINPKPILAYMFKIEIQQVPTSLSQTQNLGKEARIALRLYSPWTQKSMHDSVVYKAGNMDLFSHMLLEV